MEDHGLDYHRALLACFLLSAAVSAYSGQIDPMRWTPPLESALVAISDTYSQGDHVLAVQVRLQLLKGRAVQIRDQGHKPDHNVAEVLLVKLEELRPAVEQHQVPPLLPNLPPFRGIAFPQWAQLTRCLVAAAPLSRRPTRAGPMAPQGRFWIWWCCLDEVVGRLEGMAREAGEVVSGGVGACGVADEEMFMKLVLGLRGFRERVVGERAGRGRAGGAAAGRDGGEGVAVGDVEEERMVLAPQKGYFRNPRFWLDQIWGSGLTP
ncbi:hypothetical protein CHGG_02066 [Chaetomium globosum CBS 148.51]|uniref:Uncharacterized protein n=1 Tax=Chaetomium globosum (strain ATCC 6205 / CBS 148.51 / DSM 1962 / NBRC 6347 / NRRL 1970) TaxID=306901 RepID=Q2HCI8_CHAGB|nr:uncharacterized protein CHGG_02066 [Chaetomium globosum CBS 148.51]EAQ93831.1 hypothetical protein CHGG_02066 [Chaetomium globosum CBS 148.51]